MHPDVDFFHVYGIYSVDNAASSAPISVTAHANNAICPVFGHHPSVAPKADAAETMHHLNPLSSPWLPTEASVPAPVPMAVSTGVSALSWSMPTPTPVPAPAPAPAMHASAPSGPLAIGACLLWSLLAVDHAVCLWLLISTRLKCIESFCI